MYLWCLHISQKTNEFFARISALASKQRSNQKNKDNFYHYVIGGFYFDPLPLLFWFDFFLEARVEILEIILLVFWSKRWNQKDMLKLTDL